jgi:TamB, inner membrane protein subunit of TAM complex
LKRIVHNFIKGIIILALAGIILLATLYLLRGVLIAPHIQRFLENSIKSRLGVDVAIGNIGGSYLADFEVDDITTLKPAPVGRLVSFQLRRLRVSYNLLTLLKGLNSFLDHAGIDLVGAKLELDLSREDVSPSAPVGADSIKPIFLPERLPRIRVDDTSVYLRGSDDETVFKGISLETRSHREMTSTLQLHVREWSWTHPGFQAGKTPVSAEIEYSPEEISAKRLMLGRSELAEFVKIGLKALPETMPFEAKVQLAGGGIALEGRVGSSNLSGRIKGDHLDLAQICSFFQPRPPLEGKISLKADILLPLKQPTDLVAHLDLQLNRGKIYGLSADELNLQAAAKDGKMRLHKLDLRTGGNLVAFRDVSSSSQPVFRGDVGGILQTLTGGFSLDCRDIPAFFSLAGVDLSSRLKTAPAHRLMLDGKIGSGTITISGGSLTMDSGHIRLDPSRIALPSIGRPIKDTAIQAALDIDLPDLELLSRLFRISKLGGALQGHVKLTGTLGAPAGTADITAKGVSFKDVNYGDLRVEAGADSRAAVLESLTLRRGKDRLTGRGAFHFVKKEFTDVQLDFHLSELAFYMSRLWPENLKFAHGNPRIGGSLAGKISMKGPLTMPSGTADLKLGKINVAENQFGDAHIRLNSDGQKITVETLEIRQAKDRLSLHGSFDLRSRKLENVKLDIAIADFAAYTKNLLPETETVNAVVHANLKVSGPLQEPEAQAYISLKALQLNSFKITSAVFKLRSSGRRIHIDLAQVNAPLGEGKLAGNLLRGPADETFDLEVTDLTLSVKKALLTLKKPGHIHFTRNGAFSLKDMSLGGPSGGISLTGSLAAERTADFDISISDFNSEGWFESLATDRVGFSGLNARIHLSGRMKAPSVTVTGDLAKLDTRKGRLPLSGRFDLSYTNDGVIVRQFQWQGQPGQQIALKGTIPVNLLEKPVLRPGPLSIDAQVSIPDLAAFGWLFPHYIPSNGDLEGKLQMAGTWNAPSGTLIFRGRGLNHPHYLKWMPPGSMNAGGTIRLDGKKLMVESIQINSPGLTFTSRGEWTGMPALSKLLQGESEKLSGSVHMKGNLSVKDLSWLASEVPSVQRISGRLEADISMKGAISAPAVDAVVRLTDGELRPDMDVPALRALNLNAVVTPAGVRLQTFTGELGGADFHVTGSVMRDSQKGVAVDLRLQGENLLFYRSEGLRVRADTDLRVKGPVKRLEVGGEVAITDGRLVKYFDILNMLKGSSKPRTDMGLQLFSIRKPPFSNMVFDVRLTSKNPFTIRNNLVKGAVRPELKLTGTGQFPVLVGEVYVDPTRITLPAGSLVFESGVVRFDPNKPDRPTLNLAGTSKIFGYDVTVLVEGPYDEPVVTLSSVPPLSNEELLLLIIAGKQPKTTSDTQVSQRRSMNVAVFLGRDLIARWFGSESSEAAESMTDRFEITIGRAVTRAGEETIDAQFRIADGVLRKGDKLYITGEKDKFDFFNAGLKIVFRFR